jgi:hypothetical protein
MSDYAKLKWEEMGSPLTPIIWFAFRGGDAYVQVFPSRYNRIYIYDAQFDVINESGFSSASITLADPDFVYLEAFFMKALFLANSFSKKGNYWYCKCMWGWSYYGPPKYNPDETEEDQAQYKLSGLHYYMLSDLRYEIDDIELRVTIDLIDVGQQIFGPGDEEAARTKVGILSGENIEHEEGAGTGGGNVLFDFKEEMAGTRLEGSKDVQEAEVLYGPPRQQPDEASTGDTTSAKDSTDKEDEDKVIYNKISGRNYWEIIKLLLKNHDPEVTVISKSDNPPEDGPEDDEQPYEISAEDPLRDVIEELLAKIEPIPHDAEEDQPTKHWDILAGGYVDNEDDPTPKMVFGWVPDVPTRGMDLSEASGEIDYRLARRFVYRPGSRDEIAKGLTQIISLSYDWSSKGFWYLGVPELHLVPSDSKGRMYDVYTTDQWRGMDPEQREMLEKKVGKDEIKTVPINEAKESHGINIEYNFNTNTESSEKITQRGSTILINVWNFFVKELIEVSIEIPGDPWLDNRLFSAKGKEDSLEDLLVDFYDAYFLITTYKQDIGGGRSPSPLFEGQYLCLHGCSHKISEGEYTTSMKLFKAW